MIPLALLTHLQAQGLKDSGSTGRFVVVFDERLVTVLPFSREFIRIVKKPQQERGHAVRVAAIMVPPAIESLNEKRRGCRSGANVENRPACCHQPIYFAGNNGAERGGFLRHKADVTFRQARTQVLLADVILKSNIPDPVFMAEFNQPATF